MNSGFLLFNFNNIFAAVDRPLLLGYFYFLFLNIFFVDSRCEIKSVVCLGADPGNEQFMTLFSTGYHFVFLSFSWNLADRH